MLLVLCTYAGEEIGMCHTLQHLPIFVIPSVTQRAWRLLISFEPDTNLRSKAQSFAHGGSS